MSPFAAKDILHEATHPQTVGGLSDKQLAMRKRRIGGSEIGAVLGIDDYRTPLDIYKEKVHGLRKPANEFMAWGNYVEEAALKYLSEQCGIPTYKPRDADGKVTTLVHPQYDWVCTTPDGIEPKDSEHHRVVELKNVGRWMMDMWGDVEQEPPLKFRAQLVWTLGVTSALGLSGTTGLLVPIMGGEPPNEWQHVIEFNKPTFDAMVKVAHKFIVECVDAKVEPLGWEYDPRALDYVKERWKQQDGQMREATAEAITLMRQLKYAKVRVKKWEAIRDVSQTRLCNLVGEKLGITGVCTWKPNKKGVRTLRLADEE